MGCQKVGWQEFDSSKDIFLELSSAGNASKKGHPKEWSSLCATTLEELNRFPLLNLINRWKSSEDRWWSRLRGPSLRPRGSVGALRR